MTYWSVFMTQPAYPRPAFSRELINSMARIARRNSGTADVVRALCHAPGSVLFARSMNLHHVELFYYVAKHGGISRALRHIPYGIQQPAVSAQILRLEQDLG